MLPQTSGLLLTVFSVIFFGLKSRTSSSQCFKKLSARFFIPSSVDLKLPSAPHMQQHDQFIVLIPQVIHFITNSNSISHKFNSRRKFTRKENCTVTVLSTTCNHRYLIIPRWLTSNHRIYKVKPRYLLQMYDS